MPTALTSQIFGDNECFEPYTRYFSFVSCLLDSMFADYFFLATFTHAMSLLVNPSHLPLAPPRGRRPWSVGRHYEKCDHRTQRFRLKRPHHL